MYVRVCEVCEVCEVSRHLHTQVISVSEVVRQTTVMMERMKERPRAEERDQLHMPMVYAMQHVPC